VIRFHRALQSGADGGRAIPVPGQAAVELAPVVRPAVVTVEAHPRASVLRARTGRPRLLHVFPLVGTLGNHEARAGAGQNAQLDATGAPRARAARPSGGCRPRVALGDRVCSGWTWVRRLGLALALPGGRPPNGTRTACAGGRMRASPATPGTLSPRTDGVVPLGDLVLMGSSGKRSLARQQRHPIWPRVALVLLL
jgi:hypothetical protein